MKRGVISFILVVAFLIPLYDSVGLVTRAAKKTSDAKAQILWLENRYYSELEIKDSLKSVLANAAGPDCAINAAGCQERIANALAEWESEIQERASQDGADADAWFGSLAPGGEAGLRDSAFENGPGKAGLMNDFDDIMIRSSVEGCPIQFSPVLKSRLFVYPDAFGNVSISRSGAEILKSEYDRCRDGTLETEAAIEVAKDSIDAQLLLYTATGAPYFGVTVADRGNPRKYAYVALAKDGFSTKK